MINLYRYIAITALIVAMLRLLGELTIPQFVQDSLIFVFSQSGQWSYLVDINTMVIVIGIVLTTEFILLGWKTIKYLLSFIK